MESVVVVDDDETFTRLLETMLTLEGYRPVAVTRPDRIVATLRREHPALVLMDIHVGDWDTVAVLRELRDDKDLRTVPVIMTSGMDRGRECLDAGADAFVLKPFRPSQLMAKIRELQRPAERNGTPSSHSPPS